MTYSIVIPYRAIFHYEGLHKVGKSIFGTGKRLAHYTPTGKPMGRTVPNFLGQPNHFDRRGHTSGCSRRGKHGRILHYDRRGRLVGSSRCVLGLVWIHWERKKYY